LETLIVLSTADPWSRNKEMEIPVLETSARDTCSADTWYGHLEVTPALESSAEDSDIADIKCIHKQISRQDPGTSLITPYADISCRHKDKSWRIQSGHSHM
jgi:hypothetical protein